MMELFAGLFVENSMLVRSCQTLSIHYLYYINLEW